jgi:hypothetical protein
VHTGKSLTVLFVDCDFVLARQIGYNWLQQTGLVAAIVGRRSIDVSLMRIQTQVLKRGWQTMQLHQCLEIMRSAKYEQLGVVVIVLSNNEGRVSPSRRTMIDG